MLATSSLRVSESQHGWSYQRETRPSAINAVFLMREFSHTVLKVIFFQPVRVRNSNEAKLMVIREQGCTFNFYGSCLGRLTLESDSYNPRNQRRKATRKNMFCVNKICRFGEVDLIDIFILECDRETDALAKQRVDREHICT